MPSSYLDESYSVPVLGSTPSLLGTRQQLVRRLIGKVLSVYLKQVLYLFNFGASYFPKIFSVCLVTPRFERYGEMKKLKAL